MMKIEPIRFQKNQHDPSFQWIYWQKMNNKCLQNSHQRIFSHNNISKWWSCWEINQTPERYLWSCFSHIYSFKASIYSSISFWTRPIIHEQFFNKCFDLSMSMQWKNSSLILTKRIFW
jgi:hypothetical protein